MTLTAHYNQDNIQQIIPNVIRVIFRYGQIVPVKVLLDSENGPELVCTRWGGVFQRNTQKFYEPVDEGCLTDQEREESIRLVASPWILPKDPKIKIYKPGRINHISNRVEELSGLLARYYNK